MIETFADFERILSHLPPEAPLVFETRDHVIRGGYHVTELTAAQITGIDCGGQVSTWREASMQVMDGFGGSHMTIGKFLGLLGHSLRALPDLAEEAAFINFAPMNVGLRAYQIGQVNMVDGKARVALKERGPMCKAAERVAMPQAAVAAKSTCCGISLPQRCC